MPAVVIEVASIAVASIAVALIEEEVSTGAIFAETQVPPAVPAERVPERLATSTMAESPEAIPSAESPASGAFMEAEVFTAAAVAADRSDLL